VPVSGDFVYRERVRFGDLDPMGHVNNAVFATYVESARVGYWKAKIGTMDIILARLEIDFRAPVSYGEEVEVTARVSRFGTKSLDFEHELRVDGRVVAEAKSVCVAYDYDRGETIPLPEEWREKLLAVPA